MGTGQVDIFDIRNVIGIFNLRIQEIQTFNQDFFTRFTEVRNGKSGCQRLCPISACSASGTPV
jgi:hypothetical protein